MEWIVGGIVLGLAVWGVVIYNRLVADRIRVRAAWSDIDVQLKRRHDLVPKLVAAVKQYAEYEVATMARVTELRAQSAQLQSVADIAPVEAMITQQMHRLLGLAEAYPDLKANQQFLDLQQNITEVEDHIQMARRFYNGAVRMFNTRIESFPDLFIARWLKLQPQDYFEIELAERNP
jgi:LemA protein